MLRLLLSIKDKAFTGITLYLLCNFQRGHRGYHRSLPCAKNYQLVIALICKRHFSEVTHVQVLPDVQ